MFFRILVMVLSSLSLCSGQESSVKDQGIKIANLVSLLNSSVFADRELAMEQLSRLDEKQLPELELALKGLAIEELEARIRLGGIVTKLKNDRMVNQTKQFIRSTETDATFGFEGWKSFSKSAGTSRNAKKLFLKLIEAYPELVFVELKTKKEALDKAKELATTIAQKFQSLAGYEVPDALALLYCFNVADDLTDRSLERVTIRTFYTSPFGPLMLDLQFKKSLERLMAGWSKHVDVTSLPQCLSIFIERDFPQANTIALRLLDSELAKTEPLIFVRSMQAIYRYGSKVDLPLVEKWLDDKTLCLNEIGQGLEQRFGNPLVPQETFTAEYRDIALLVSMHLAGEDFMPTFPKFQPLTLWGFREESVMLPTNATEQRKNRIENWKSKRSKQD